MEEVLPLASRLRDVRVPCPHSPRRCPYAFGPRGAQPFGGGPSPGPGVEGAGGAPAAIGGAGGACRFFRDLRRIPAAAATTMIPTATTRMMVQVHGRNPRKSPPTLPCP